MHISVHFLLARRFHCASPHPRAASSPEAAEPSFPTVTAGPSVPPWRCQPQPRRVPPQRSDFQLCEAPPLCF